MEKDNKDLLEQEDNNTDMEELLEAINEAIEENLPKIEIDTDDCQKVKLNIKEFEKGIKEMSCVCGQIAALQSCGITASEALSYINGREIEKHNKELQKLINNGELEAAKEGASFQRKNSL